MAEEFDLEARIAELTAERDAALAQLPAADKAYAAAFEKYQFAQARWNAFVAKLNRAVRHGEQGTGEIVPVTANVQDVIDAKRREYNVVAAAVTRAKTELANLRWVIEGRNIDLEQLQKLVNPPKKGEHFVGTAERSRPPAADTDSIVFPPSNSTRAA